MRGQLFVPIVLSLLAAPALEAQNLVVNGSFDGGVSGWPIFAGSGTLTYSSLDAGGRPTSGSGLVTNMVGESSGEVRAAQCIGGITGLESYDFGARIRLPSGQARTGYAFVIIFWYSSTDCTTGFLGFDLTAIVSNPLDSWEPNYAAGVVAPSGAQNVMIVLDSFKNEAGGSWQNTFDGVVLGLSGTVPLVLFADGLESGNLSGWSSSVP